MTLRDHNKPLPSATTLTLKDLRFNPPRFERTALAAFAYETFGKSGPLKPLGGERDQNHLLTTPDGLQFVLKVSGADEDTAVVDFQVQALLRLENVAPDLNVPRIIATLDGTPTARLSAADGTSHQVRLMTYVPGVPFYLGPPPSLRVLKEIGAFQGKLCRALEGFHHTAATHFMPWDTSNGLVLHPDLSRGRFGDIERLVAPLFRHFERNVLPDDERSSPTSRP